MDWLVLTRQSQIRLLCFCFDYVQCFGFETHAILLPLWQATMLKPCGTTDRTGRDKKLWLLISHDSAVWLCLWPGFVF
jgi:hypothetical protein